MRFDVLVCLGVVFYDIVFNKWVGSPAVDLEGYNTAGCLVGTAEFNASVCNVSD